MPDNPENPLSPTALALATDLHAVLGRLRRKLRKQAHLGDLNWTQKCVLRHLETDGPATVTVLARAEGMRPQSMGPHITSLIKAGLVEGAPDPNDGRQTLLSLTPSCREWIQASRALREDWLYHVILDNFSRKEQQTLAEATRLLQRMVDVDR
ncbi:MarR family transcriptional regulator [Thalassospira profundimaris]|uniref:MarR family transcriptional regulator n=1 Tax=Thalassospira profundimaris TaxID=502049 RepID=A0A367XG59_9PROT|nr:MarR family transcriptional regulator [Thalassospira profundimaris]RCK51662.1 MarR family transcriptional regulator [Thalassospira profundimaris]